MESKRMELLRRNSNIIHFPMPNFEEMTNEELESRASMWETFFAEEFNTQNDKERY